MKVKLKKGEQLSSNFNHCNLKYDDWSILIFDALIKLLSLKFFVKYKLFLKLFIE